MIRAFVRDRFFDGWRARVATLWPFGTNTTGTFGPVENSLRQQPGLEAKTRAAWSLDVQREDEPTGLFFPDREKRPGPRGPYRFCPRPDLWLVGSGQERRGPSTPSTPGPELVKQNKKKNTPRTNFEKKSTNGCRVREIPAQQERTVNI